MKAIKFNNILMAVAVTMALSSCKKDFVDITPQGQFLSENYYANQDQAFAALVATYDPVRKNSGGFENMLALMNAGSDDHVAGGGSATDGNQLQAFSNYTMTANLMAASYWNDPYQGIFRANVLLKRLPAVPMDDNLKARFEGEAKALRAFYYFNLVRMFKNIPLLTEPLTASTMYQVEQAKPEDVYAQIEKDLTEAINVLPATISLATEGGRLTKGAAKALLGKVYLYEKKNALAAQQLADVNGPTPGGTSTYGYKLLTNFGDLWNVNNKFNTESIFEETHSAQGNSDWGFWGSGRDEGNTFNVMCGPRSYQKKDASAPDLPSGWAFSIVTQSLYDALKNDPRFGATILDIAALKAAGKADYIAAYMNTGYFLNKFLPRTADVSKGGGASELNYKQNTYIIRLADTYLMEAEALGGTGARAQALLDAVRARVGLASVPVSLAAIKSERRLELAGEGHRWFDLVRWGDAATLLSARGFKAGKHEIFPIPFRELQGTKLIQNPDYQ